MTLIPEIAFDDVEVSAAIEEKIKGRVSKLVGRFERLTHARVVVSAPNRGPHKPKLYAVKIALGVPGRPELVVASGTDPHNEHHEVHGAIREAFDMAERRLDESAQRLRGEVKTRTSPGT